MNSLLELPCFPSGLNRDKLTEAYDKFISRCWAIRRVHTRFEARRVLMLSISQVLDVRHHEVHAAKEEMNDLQGKLASVDPQLTEAITDIIKIFSEAKAARAFIWTAAIAFDVGDTKGGLVKVEHN